MHVEGYAARPKRMFGLEIFWWGFGQWYKWRWHGDHVDLGPLSIYGIERPWLWSPLRIGIKPMRWAYHYWLRTPKVQERNRMTLERLAKQREMRGRP